MSAYNHHHHHGDDDWWVAVGLGDRENRTRGRRGRTRHVIAAGSTARDRQQYTAIHSQSQTTDTTLGHITV